MRYILILIICLGLLYSVSHAITLEWDEPVNGQVTGYNVYRAPSMSSPFSKIATVTAVDTNGDVLKQFIDPNDQPGMCWRVTAFNEIGESQASNNFCIFIAVPSNPRDLGMPVGGGIESQ